MFFATANAAISLLRIWIPIYVRSIFNAVSFLNSRALSLLSGLHPQLSAKTGSASIIVLRGLFSPCIREYKTSQAFTPEAYKGLFTVVRTGNALRALKVLSNPVTATSSGTLTPFNWSLFIAVRAMLSLAQTKASGKLIPECIKSSIALIPS